MPEKKIRYAQHVSQESFVFMDPSRDTVFTAVRHGQTDANLSGVLQGHLDTPLDEIGRAQARIAAERLKQETFDLFYTSDLSRAVETARIIGEALKMEPVSLPDLREWHLGELEGRPHDELKHEFPEVIRSFRHDMTDDIPVPGGESRNEFFARVGSCLDRLRLENPGARILLVTHGGTLRAVYRHIAGVIDPGCLIPQPVNAGISRFRSHEGSWQMLSWNETAHLAGIGQKESLAF